MAGYWSKSRTQEIDSNGNLIVGALAYYYEATTSTPMSTYSSADLGTPNVHTHPVVADGNARWPQVFFDDTDPDPDDPLVSGRQFYRVRVTDAAGVLIYDDDSVPIIGTVSGEGGGGGGVPVDQNALAKTGDVKMKFCRAADPADDGWLRCNGGTISKGGSGGSEMADAATQDLYEYLWNTHTFPTGNLVCPVVPSRGGSALEDFNNGLKLTLPDMRGKAPFGVDTMGAPLPANLIAPAYVDTAIPGPGIARDTVGAVGGDDDIALTTAQIPAHSHGATGVPAEVGPPAVAAKVALQAADHGHPARYINQDSVGGSNMGGGLVANSAETQVNKPAYLGKVATPPGPPLLNETLGNQIGGSGLLAITGNTSLAGGPAAALTGVSDRHENMPPFMLIQFQIKL